MTDPRYKQLAEQIIGYSCRVQPGEHVNLRMIDIPDAMVVALIRATRAVGGIPHVDLYRATISRELSMGATEAQYELEGRYRLQRAQDMDVHICFYGDANSFESADVPSERMKIVSKYMREASNFTCNKRKWCVLAWPTPAMAQAAGMATEDFEDFYFRCCLADYARMKEGMQKIKDMMESTDEVRIIGPGTDLRFSIKGIPAIICSGDCNVPDGEVYTAPVRDSINGTITYNAPSIYNGIPFDGVKFRFENGKIVEAHCNGNEEKLLALLDSDEGARFIGEFALGVNPYILKPMRDILFDEKIAGSFHLTPGQCYDEAPNGNESSIHWDLVCIQRAEFGGGEIYFDGKLIRKDGIFTDPELAIFNPICE
ncbi:MAG: aminopeptidase [Akkermansia sp.]|nr:aminopeptidase [Akkermansia sp.]